MVEYDLMTEALSSVLAGLREGLTPPPRRGCLGQDEAGVARGSPHDPLRHHPFPSDDALRPLRRSAWGDEGPASWRPVLDRSLAHVAAYDGDELVGFVNVAWDGGQHAFILDTSVHRDWQRQGIATQLVAEAATAARERGASWLHVDFDPHLESFYRGCGFIPTPAGLIRLA